MHDATDEVLTIREASRFLRIGKTTLYKLARKEEIPTRKVGREWRFAKPELIRWLKEKRN